MNLDKNGPTADHDGMRIFYFMNVWAQDGQLDDEGAWLQSPLIEGKEHPFGCFHFWFTFKVNCVLWIENYHLNHSGILHSKSFSFHGKINSGFRRTQHQRTERNGLCKNILEDYKT